MQADIAVVGAGAAGLLAALAARGAVRDDGSVGRPGPAAPKVILLDGKQRIGRKILVSGGGRCNVTNAQVGMDDFVTEAPNVAKTVLAAFPVASVRAFFEDHGVKLREEPLGKLYPVGNAARQVLEALVAAVEDAGILTRFGEEVRTLEPDGDLWVVNNHRVRRVILATGGLSLPKTGSTGFGFRLAGKLGHDLVPPVPSLSPLFAEVPKTLAGITLPAILSVQDPEGRTFRRSAGSLLFTHNGVSGPAALDASLAMARERQEGHDVRVIADFWSLADQDGPFAPWLEASKPPGACLPSSPAPAEPRVVEDALQRAVGWMPKASVGAFLSRRLPKRLVETLVPSHAEVLATLTKEDRRAAARAVTRYDLGVTAVGGFDRAEVTSGGIRLTELERRTLESRLAPGLHACGEVCDVTGRLGGFNFQWAWASGFVAGSGAAASLRETT
ncbi:MAG: BaiN/RdsA family NAD(P)/FAD-dependent oxidoreductase [Planctomycetota bacterium]